MHILLLPCMLQFMLFVEEEKDEWAGIDQQPEKKIVSMYYRIVQITVEASIFILHNNICLICKM